MREGKRALKWGRWLVLALVILLGLYLASPLIALYDIASAVETKDAAAITERIEFPALKR